MARGSLPERSDPSRTPLAEWIVGGLGLLTVVAMLAVLLLEAARGPAGPPLLTITDESLRPTPSGWLRTVTVRNSGDRTAAGVEIEGRLGEETASATIDYVPAGGSAEAALLFGADPQAAEIRVVGFTEP